MVSDVRALLICPQCEPAEGFLQCFEITPDQLPVVIAPGEKALRNPSTTALADELGLTETIDARPVYDVAVVVAGPGGAEQPFPVSSFPLDFSCKGSIAEARDERPS